MYIHLKSFFKSKYIKIYTIVFVSVFIVLTLFYNFYEYYSNFKNSIYQENTYFLLKSNNEIFNNVKKVKNVINIERVVLFEDNNNNFEINWSNLTDSHSKYLIGIVNNDSQYLQNGELILSIPKSLLELFPEIKKLKGENIIMSSSNEVINFKIKEVKESVFSRAILSNYDYERLMSKSEYGYIFDLVDYEQKDEIYKELFQFEFVEELDCFENYEGEKNFITIDELKNVIIVLKYGCILFFIIFIILYIIFIIEIINREIAIMKLEFMLGYNTKQIKQILFFKMFVLNFIVLITSILCYTILRIIIKETFLNNNIIIILYLFFVSILISLILCSLKIGKKYKLIN